MAERISGGLHGRRVLVVDDDPNVRGLLAEFLAGLGLEVTAAADGGEALACMEKGEFDLLLTDLRMPRVGGLDLLEKCARLPASPLPVVLTGHGSIDSAVQAMRLGAFDYITKPLHLDEIRVVVEKAMDFRRLRRENVQLRQQLREKYRFDNLVGHSEAMQDVFRMVEKVADTDSTVLIFGESGTGKELIARALHFNSRRRDNPLVVVNCSAIPHELLESELYGHEQGAFTGAVKSRMGKFEAANGGTVFLDEIGDMTLALQAKLLRVLQEQEIERLGSTRPVRVDIRVIAATHRNLEEAIRQGRFREDLFYRLNVIPIAVPPLRKRASDIPILVAHFLETYNRSKGKGVEGFAPESLAILARYPWPGNVRELEHLVERVVVLKGEGIVEPRDLPEPYAGDLSHVAMPRHSLPEVGIDLPAWLREMERSLIVQALERTRGVRSRACQLLGIHRTTLVEKMRKLGLLESEFGQGA